MPSFRSFSDELQKIAFGAGAARNVATAATGAARGAGKSFMNEFWQGSRFNKGMALLGAAGAVGEAIPENDPRNQGRSRTERVMAAPGNIVGGTFGSMLGSRMMGGKGIKGIVGSVVGGMAGGFAGEGVTSAPWRRARLNETARASALARQQQMAPEQPMQPAGMAPANGVVA